ncbi:hypothetical protein [Streptomyces sp. MBT65]|uniref:hypothetical protein n=1 Tax=Streptomyces sp. MBT65 TaxID=1488395 RepID=UPI0035AEFE62
MPSIQSVTVHSVPASSTASTTGATRVGHCSTMTSVVRRMPSVIRTELSPSGTAGRVTCVRRQGRSAIVSSPYQETRLVSRWATSMGRYLPATDSCTETCVSTMAIPR